MRSICSTLEPYRGWRWPLVTDPQGFVDRLAWCVENRETVREHGLAWREAVLAERSIERTLDGWRAAVDGFSPGFGRGSNPQGPQHGTAGLS